MKILVLSDDFPPNELGGAGIMAFRLSKEFVRQGHEVRVLTSVENIIGKSTYVIDGITVQQFQSRYPYRWRAYVCLWNPKALKVVKKIISDFNPDVVHAHNVHAHISYASLALARKSVARVIMTAHDPMSFYQGSFAEFIDPTDLSCPDKFDYKVNFFMMLKKFRLWYNPFRNFVIKGYLEKVNRIIVVSESLKDALVQNGIDNCIVIHNGVEIKDRQVPENETELFKANLNLQNKDVVLFCGRLSAAKGGNLILRAMSEVVKINPKAVLLVAGKLDSYAKMMKNKAESLGLKNHIVFTGWLNETGMGRAYAASSLVVVPSIHLDPFPNVNLEALSFGKPVVATCFGGSREVIHNGENGYIVNPFNIPVFTRAIIDLLVDKSKVERFGGNGRRLIAEKYTIEKVAAEYLSMLFK